jgi:gamma-glutamylcyclotransferase (GGCT)/AIG2-like uncharacterized protein YtfP
MENGNKHLVFVYGTLRRGYRLYGALVEGGAEFVGPAVTVNKFHMTAAGFPFVNPNIQTSRITGEVYKVNDLLLQRLDGIEGFRKEAPDKSFYFRAPVDVKMADGTLLQPGIYFSVNGMHAAPVPSGDYADFCKPEPVEIRWALKIANSRDPSQNRTVYCASALAARKRACKIRKGDFNHFHFKIVNSRGQITRYSEPSTYWRIKWYTW